MDKKFQTNTPSQSYFAVVPDDKAEQPALFSRLEDAIEWGMARFGDDRYSIRGVGPEALVGSTDARCN